MGLNLSQESAVNSTAKKILCLAGAGTGKTYTMIARIKHLVDQGVPPESILALTFTNAAAFEMKDRFTKLSNSPRIPEFRTFHSFCYHLIITNSSVRMALGYSSIPTVAEPEDLKQIEKACLLKLGIKQSYRALAKSTDLRDQDMLKVYNKAFAKEMRTRGLITFDRLCYGVCEMFKDNKPYIMKYKDQYEYIFVDEFQDTDPRQWEFVSSFPDSNLFVVGDALQAIYGFRGADSSIIKALAVDPEWEVIRLVQNYRSTGSICDYANGNSKHADPAYRVDIISERSLGQSVDVIPCKLKSSWYLAPEAFDMVVADWRNQSNCSGAILCRTNAEVEAVGKELTKRGIDFISGKQNNEAIHLLKSALDSKYALDWLSTYLNAEKYAYYIRVETISALPDDDDEDRLERFLNMHKNAMQISYRWKAIQRIWELSQDTEELAISRWSSLCRYLSVDVPDPEDLSDDIGWQDMLNLLAEAASASKESSLYVGTIHSSKGLEYDVVYLLHVGSHTFKLIDEAAKNLFYVGITRARDRLVVEIQL
jgi:DNA helicase-2/ATP-dependent DNA helicase PcrA